MKRFAIVILLLFVQIAVSGESSNREFLTLASYNIRWQSAGDAENGDAWSKRKRPIADLIRFYDFDIVGIQEGSASKNAALRELLPGYEFLTLDSNDANPLLVRKGMFRVRRAGRFYLSSNPGKRQKGWDAKHIRYCNWFELEFEGKRFFVFNTHFDYHGKKAKLESARFVPEKVQSIAREKPFLFSGDFNSAAASQPYELLTSSGILLDAKSRAEFSYEVKKSYNYFDPQKYSPWDLDHIFTNSLVHIHRFGVLNDVYYDGEKFRYPSDHSPLVVVFRLEN